MNFIILGQAGSGKGTQSEMLAQKFKMEHFDAGKALRQVAKLETELGREVNDIINVRKELVPSHMLEEILRLKLNSLPREQGVVFDGVPRNLEQAHFFEKILGEFGRKIDKVYYVKVADQDSIERIAMRRVCKSCKSVFILGKQVKGENDPCPNCGQQIMQRVDDTIEGTKKRLAVFQQETVPAIEYFRDKGLLVEIDGSRPADKVFADILEHLHDKN